MSGMEDFKDTVTRLGGIWSGNDVYYSQQRDQYTADYRPKYPECSLDDQTIHRHLDHTSLARQLGRYEYIRYYPEEGKCRSVYVRARNELLMVARGELS